MGDGVLCYGALEIVGLLLLLLMIFDKKTSFFLKNTRFVIFE